VVVFVRHFETAVLDMINSKEFPAMGLCGLVGFRKGCESDGTVQQLLHVWLDRVVCSHGRFDEA